MKIQSAAAFVLAFISCTTLADFQFANLEPSDDTWDRPTATGAQDLGPCNTQVADSFNDAVPYDLYYIRAVNHTTLLDISVYSNEPNPIDLDPMIIVYCGQFDPSMPNVNVEDIDDDSAGYPNPAVLSSNFADPNSLYAVVVSSYSNYAPSQYGAYEINLGPGLIFTSACLPDFSNDGVLDFFDISAFLNLFNAQHPSTDLNHDNNYDFFDVSEFLAAYANGCP